MIALLYVLAVCSMSAQSALSKLGGRLDASTFRFNFYKAAFAFIMFGTALAVSERTIDPYSLVFGAFYGISLSFSMYFGYTALACGPLSLTSMLVSFSLIIPCIYGVVFLNETISTPAYFGFTLLVVTLILLGIKKRPVNAQNQKKPSLFWAMCVFLTIVANGISSVIQKVYSGSLRFNFMTGAMLVCTAVFAVLALAKKELFIRPKSSDIVGGGAGMLNGLSNFFTLWLASMNPATLLFPLMSASTMLCALVVGKVFFKEKLSVFQLIGFVLGIASVMLLNM